MDIKVRDKVAIAVGHGILDYEKCKNTAADDTFTPSTRDDIIHKYHNSASFNIAVTSVTKHVLETIRGELAMPVLHCSEREAPFNEAPCKTCHKELYCQGYDDARSAVLEKLTPHQASKEIRNDGV